MWCLAFYLKLRNPLCSNMKRIKTADKIGRVPKIMPRHNNGDIAARRYQYCWLYRINYRRVIKYELYTFVLTCIYAFRYVYRQIKNSFSYIDGALTFYMCKDLLFPLLLFFHQKDKHSHHYNSTQSFESK